MSAGRTLAALAAVNLSAVVFGSAALFGKLEVSPLWIVAGRSAFAAAALFFVVVSLRKGLLPSAPLVPRIACTAIVLALHWMAFFASVQVGGVAIATLTVSTFPLFTLLIEARRAKRLPDPLELVCGAAIVVAIWLISRPDGDGAAVGALLGVAAAVLFALFSLTSQRLVRELGALRLALWQYALVALITAPVVIFVPAPSGPTAWGALALLGVVGTALAHQLYLFGLGRLPAAACGGVVSLEPVYAIVLAALIFGDPVGPAVVVSAVLIVGASVLLLRRRDRPS